MIERRSLLLGLVSSLAAPALVRASSLDGLHLLRRENLDPLVWAYRQYGPYLSPFWGYSALNTSGYLGRQELANKINADFNSLTPQTFMTDFTYQKVRRSKTDWEDPRKRGYIRVIETGIMTEGENVVATPGAKGSA